MALVQVFMQVTYSSQPWKYVISEYYRISLQGVLHYVYEWIGLTIDHSLVILSRTYSSWKNAFRTQDSFQWLQMVSPLSVSKLCRTQDDNIETAVLLFCPNSFVCLEVVKVGLNTLWFVKFGVLLGWRGSYMTALTQGRAFLCSLAPMMGTVIFCLETFVQQLWTLLASEEFKKHMWFSTTCFNPPPPPPRSNFL